MNLLCSAIVDRDQKFFHVVEGTQVSVRLKRGGYAQYRNRGGPWKSLGRGVQGVKTGIACLLGLPSEESSDDEPHAQTGDAPSQAAAAGAVEPVPRTPSVHRPTQGLSSGRWQARSFTAAGLPAGEN